MKNHDIQISKEALSLDKAYDYVREDDCGGNVLFIGTVRNHAKGQAVTQLDFSAYHEMAISEMIKIAGQCLNQFDIVKVAIHHREGVCKIGDIAVIIAVSAHHRKAAFMACEYTIDKLKETVPIWKKEYLTDGSYWVNAHP